MPTRAAHLTDIETRLAGKIAKVGDRVYRSRTKTLDPARHLPAICLYAPDEDSGPSIVTGGHAQYRPTHTLAIEIRVAEKDGFDVEAGAITEAVKTLLFTDPAWSGRFQPHPTWRVRQFFDRRGEQTFCGEVLTITAADKKPTAYPPAAPLLTGITAQADVDGDGAADITSQADAPEDGA